MIDFPAGTTWVNRNGYGIAVTSDPDARFYLCRGGQQMRLVPIDTDDHPDPAAPGVAPTTDEE